MQIINIDNINPKLKQFLFESRKMVLKYPSLDFNCRCYTKILDASYQYYTIVPDAICNGVPFDILTRYIEFNNFISYILIGNFAALDDKNAVYKKLIANSKLEENSLEGSSLAKLKLLREYYNEDKLDGDFKSKILTLKEKFDSELNPSLISEFNYTYYQYYTAIECARRQKIDCALLSEGVSKTYVR